MRTRGRVYVLLALGIAALVMYGGGEGWDDGPGSGRGVFCDLGSVFGLCDPTSR